MSISQATSKPLYDLAKLRAASNAAMKEKGQHLARTELPKNSNDTALRNHALREDKRIAELRLKLVVAQILKRMNLESLAGRHHAPIYSFGRDEFKPNPPMPNNHPFSICEPEWLMGTAKLVYEHCAANVLKPTIERWNGDREHLNDYGFNIVVHW